MKCNKCQAEWKVQKEFDSCPFCGASLKQQKKQGNFETVDEFFSYALSTFGLGLLSDSRKLISYLTDLAPTLTREKNLLRMAIESGVYKKIISANGESDSEKESCFTRCKIILVDDYFLRSDWADKTLHWLTDYLGWKLGKVQQSAPQQTAAATPIPTQKKVLLGQFANVLQTTQRKNDIEVGGLQNFISAGYVHTVGLKKDGTVVAVGDKKFGQCEVSSWRDIVAISVCDRHTLGLKKDGSVVSVGWGGFVKYAVPSWRDIVAFSSGEEHTVGLKKDGTVVAVGEDKCGQCNVSSWRDITSVSAGHWHTVGIKKDGTVVAVGYNDCGQCNVSSWRDITSVSAGRWHTVGLKKDGTVVAVGKKDFGQCNVSTLRDITSVSAGFFHTVGLKKDGTVVAVGDNSDGQCNVSSWRDIVAVAAGYFHTVGLKKDGTVVAVGDNKSGQCNVSSWNLFN